MYLPNFVSLYRPDVDDCSDEYDVDVALQYYTMCQGRPSCNYLQPSYTVICFISLYRSDVDDCSDAYDVDVALQYYTMCQGRPSCNYLQPSYTVTTCDHDIYLDKTNYIILDYECISSKNTYIYIANLTCLILQQQHNLG